MFILSQKLKNLKTIMKAWNKYSSGDVNRNVEEAVKSLEVVQVQVSINGISDELYE